MDLFDDLPEPTQPPAPLSTASPRIANEKERREDKPLKRKRDEANDAEQEEEEEEEEEHSQTKVCKEGLPVLKGYVAARRGEREEMQDAHVLLSDMSGCLEAPSPHVRRLSYFAVFDGHGGARASRFAAENLHQVLAKRFPSGEWGRRRPDVPGETDRVDQPIRRCLLDAFRQTDEDFLRKASSQKPAWKDGSTATCLLVVDDVAYVANLGDSRAVLCRTEAPLGEAGAPKRWATLALSREHNPTIYEERMRIQRAGGTVRDGRVLGVLEVSRSIGDGQYKRCGVISTPDLRRCQLTANDRFIILACDGLFKVFSADEAVKFVLGVLQVLQAFPKPQEGGLEQRAGLVEAAAEEALRYEAACQQLAGEAVRRGCADNVTVILVSIGY